MTLRQKVVQKYRGSDCMAEPKWLMASAAVALDREHLVDEEGIRCVR